MRILVTGNEGFVGSHLMKVLPPDTQGFDIKSNRDIEDFILIKDAMRDVDVVVHLAALTSVEESKSDPESYYLTNIVGTSCVIRAAIENNVKRIIYASSSSCYDPTSTPYALSKYVPELMLKHHKFDIDSISLRFFNIYGEGQNPAYAGVIPSFERDMRQKGRVTIYGDGNQTRDFIAVEDIADAISRAVYRPEIPSGEVIDIGTGRPTSVNEIHEMMQDILDIDSKVDFEPARKEVRHSKADTKRAKNLLDFEAKIELKNGLRRLFT